MTENIDEIGKGVHCKSYIVIPSEEEKFAYDKEHFLIPSHYKDDIKNIMIPRGVILDRIEKLAMDIYETYGDQELHIICVLKGSRGFFSALVEILNRIRRYTAGHKTPPYIEHYVRLKSYSGMESTGRVQVMADDLTTLHGKHVLVVEDIIDTGRSLSYFCRHLLQYKPATIRLASLLLKNLPKDAVSMNVKPDFCGFLIPPEFIVGFCLDYNEMFRDLEHIAVISEQGIEKYKHHS